MSRSHTINRIILSTGALYHLPLPRIFGIAQKSGFDGLELIFNEDHATTNVVVIRELIRKFDLPVLSAHIPMDDFRNFGKSAQEIITQCITIGNQIGIEKLVIHPWRKGLPDYSGELSSLLATIRDKSSIILLIENLPRQIGNVVVEEQYYIPALLTDFFEQPLCLDTSHLATTKLNFKDTFSRVVSLIKHVHLSDSNLQTLTEVALKDDHLFVGTGKLPLQWVIDQLNAIYYEGDYCMELRPVVFGKKGDDEIASILGQVVSRTRRMLEQKNNDEIK